VFVTNAVVRIEKNHSWLLDITEASRSLANPSRSVSLLEWARVHSDKNRLQIRTQQRTTPDILQAWISYEGLPLVANVSANGGISVAAIVTLVALASATIWR